MTVSVIAVISAAMVCLPAAAASAWRSAAPKPTPLTFGLATARSGKIDVRPYYSYSGSPGGLIQDQVAIVNIGTQPVTLHLFATDSIPTTDGSFGLLPTAAKPVDAGTWIALAGPSILTVPARTAKGPSTIFMPVTVKLPSGASPGDHAAGIVASLLGSAIAGKVAVKLDQRVALRVYVHVSGLVQPKLTITNLHIGYAGPAIVGNPFADGAATLTYTVKNTGNVLLGASQSATVSPWIGSDVTVSSLPVIPALLPGSSITMSRRVPGVFPGIHISASIKLKPLAPLGEVDPTLVPVSDSGSVWAFPWTLIILIAALIGGVGFGIWWRRRRPADPTGRKHAAHRPADVLAKTGK